MIIPKSGLKLINRILFSLVLILRSLTDGLYISKGIESNLLIKLKFVVLIISFIFAALQVYKNKKEKIFKKEMLNGLIIVFVLLIISLFYVIANNVFFSITLVELMKLIVPIVYAYLILNTLEFDDIYYSMVIILFFAIVGYIFEIGINRFSLVNILSISFDESYSPFESSYFAGTAITLCTFFMFYRKNKILTVLSLLFPLLTFKRLAVLYAIFIFIIPFFIDINKEINNKAKRLIKIFFVVATLVYLYLLLPSSSDLFFRIFHKTQAALTMGRSNFLNRILNNGFINGGFGSTTAFLGKNMEMDLIKILLETSIFGLILFIWIYLDFCGKSLYLHIFMFYLFLNLLTSHSLTNYHGWILAFVIIGCIKYKQPSNLEYLKYRKRNKKR